MTARLFDETVNHAETETRSLAHRLGGEKRLEDMFERLAGNAFAIVPHRQHDIGAGNHFRLLGGIFGIEHTVGGFDNQPATAGHGVAGVDRQIEQGIFQLRLIGFAGPEALSRAHLDLDRFAKRPAQHIGHVRNKRIHIDDGRLQRLAA